LPWLIDSHLSPLFSQVAAIVSCQGPFHFGGVSAGKRLPVPLGSPANIHHVQLVSRAFGSPRGSIKNGLQKRGEESLQFSCEWTVLDRRLGLSSHIQILVPHRNPVHRTTVEQERCAVQDCLCEVQKGLLGGELCIVVTPLSCSNAGQGLLQEGCLDYPQTLSVKGRRKEVR